VVKVFVILHCKTCPPVETLNSELLFYALTPAILIRMCDPEAGAGLRRTLSKQ